MPNQSSFPGFGDVPPNAPPSPLPKAKGSPKPAKKGKLPFSVFFSIFLPAVFAKPIAEQVTGFGIEHGLVSKPLLPHRLHITLHDLGNFTDVPAELVQLALSAGNAMKAGAFDVTFNHAMSFPSSGTYVVCGDADGTAALVAFREALGAAMLEAGLKVKKSFTPHMTVAYDRTLIAKHDIDPITWTAGEFMLIKSHVGKGIYDELGRWPLRT
ncbi:MAG: 2'-5' RNA ligase family protein [Pseudomonadota bacterium]